MKLSLCWKIRMARKNNSHLQCLHPGSCWPPAYVRTRCSPACVVCCSVLNVIFLYMSLLPACIYVRYGCTWWRLLMPEQGTRLFRIRVTGGCKTPCGSWELNSGSPREQQLLLITESPLQPLWLCFLEQSPLAQAGLECKALGY